MKKAVLSVTVPLLILFIFINKNTGEEKNYYTIPATSLKRTTKNEKILLPIEVLGAQGTIEERLFDLDSNTLSSADKLWFMVNNLSYENKGSIRINEGD